MKIYKTMFKKSLKKMYSPSMLVNKVQIHELQFRFLLDLDCRHGWKPT